MACHVAILRPPYPGLILDGVKTIESRLSKQPVEPFGKVRAGDRLFLMESGGAFFATALAGRVWTEGDAPPSRIDELARTFDDRVCGGADYWRAKREARFVTLIAMRNVEPWSHGPDFARRYLKAWYVLDDSACPFVDVPVTGAGIRNGYAHWPDSWPKPAGVIELDLPGGETVTTDLASGRRLRERGWGRRYAAANLGPGDALRWVRTQDPARYRVLYRQAPPCPAPPNNPSRPLRPRLRPASAPTSAMR
ncbi:MAG: ASCH domain-containing protein [Planctomycetota bacterium]